MLAEDGFGTALLARKGEKMGTRRCCGVVQAEEHPWDEAGQSRSVGAAGCSRESSPHQSHQVAFTHVT